MTTTTEPAKALTADDMRDAAQVKRTNASGKHARRVRARPVAAPEQLGPLARAVFEDAGYADARPGLARRPRDRRRGQRAPRGVRRQVGRRHRRPPPRRDRRRSTAKPVVIGHSFGGLLTQILAGRGLRGRVGRHRSGAVPGRAAAADLGAAGRRRRC